MKLTTLFFRRRLWILVHHWLTELSLTLLLPVVVYLSIVFGLKNILQNVIEGILFEAWVQPGLVFVVVLVSSYFPLFSDLFENRRTESFYESIMATPNSSMGLASALIFAMIPEVLIRAFIAIIILQFLSGLFLPILPMIGFLFFILIFALLVVNLSFTLALVTKSSVLHLFGVFTIFLAIIFSSGWIIPLESFPVSLENVFALLPTAMLINGGRELIFSMHLTLITWLVPLLIAIVWQLLNMFLFTRVMIR